uniref:Translational initiation factor 1 n=1 Tax=Allium tenuissimum TaxID=165669 RepID=A0A8E6ZAH4_9ASPA|nr:translational initiation factor 1 [Allium tenuissimum]
MIHEGWYALRIRLYFIFLSNEDLILGYISGKIRRSLIQTLPGDRIKLEVIIHSTRGRIIYRLRNKDSND